MEYAEERVQPSACDSSVASLNCEDTLDGVPGQGLRISCDLLPEGCDFASEGCTDNGCVRDTTLAYIFDQPVTIERLRYRADYWTKRPRGWQLWVSDDETVTPNDGAVLVTSGTGHEAPWACVAGESCMREEVPDLCCPNGRDQVQAPPKDTEALWDDQRFESGRGRVWWFRIQDTYDPSELRLREVELFAEVCVETGP